MHRGLSTLSNMADRALSNLAPGPGTLDHLVALVAALRPDWDPGTLRAVLVGHSDHCRVSDLAVAAIRAAQVEDYRSPKAIGWRGPHWDLTPRANRPVEQRARPRCRTCGKDEAACYSTRPRVLDPALVDDHTFEAVGLTADRRVSP